MPITNERGIRMESWLLVIFTAINSPTTPPHYIQFASEADCKQAVVTMTAGLSGLGRTVWCLKGGKPIRADLPAQQEK